MVEPQAKEDGMASESRPMPNQSQRKECPVLRASLPSKILFWWVTGIVSKGYKRPLEPGDIYKTIPHMTSEANEACLRRVTAKATRNPSSKASGLALLWNLARSFPALLLCSLGCGILTEVIRLCQPFLLGWLLDYVTDDVTDDDVIPEWRGWLYTGLIIVTTFMFILCSAHAHYFGQIFGLKCRAALSTAIYRKVLKIWTSEHQKITTGYIVNLLATDVEQINTP